jgi:hypothetical protein
LICTFGAFSGGATMDETKKFVFAGFSKKSFVCS